MLVLMSLLVCISLVSLFISCGRRHSGSFGGVPKTSSSAPVHKLRTVAEGIKDLEALPVPKRADPVKFQAMKAELKRLLLAKDSGKEVQAVPRGDVDKVDTLTAKYNSTGPEVDLQWVEKLNGDYDNSGEVYVTDIIPLATYSGYFTSDWVDQGQNRIVDGDGIPLIGSPGDLPAISYNYEVVVSGYRIWRSTNNGNNWSQLSDVDRTGTPPTSERPTYSFADTDLQGKTLSALRYKVQPYWHHDNFNDLGLDPTVSDPVSVSNPTLHSISGTVTYSGQGVSGVTMCLYANSLSGDPFAKSVTTQLGTYVITGVPSGSYILVPMKLSCSFTPWDRSETVTTSDITGQNFTKTTNLYSASGRVTNSFDVDLGMPNVTVSIFSPTGYNPHATSDSDGYYSFGTVLGSGVYKGYPSKAGCRFTGDTFSMVVIQNASYSVNFEGWGLLDTSGWPKFRGTSDNTGLALGDGPSDLYAPTWTYQTSGAVSTSPVFDRSGIIYIGNDSGTFYAVNSDGSLNWSYSITTSAPIKSSAAVAGDETVYVGGEDGSLYAFNTTSTGNRLRWSYPAGTSVESAPTIGRDGIIYVASADGYVSAMRPTADPDDDRVKWSYNTSSTIYSSPAIGDDGTIYVGATDGYVYALDASDGTRKWRFAASNPIKSSPAVSWSADRTHEVVYAADIGSSGNPAYVYAIDARDGSQIWSFASAAGGYFDASPAVSLDAAAVYIGSDDQDTTLYAINASDGSEIWSTSVYGGTQSSVAIGYDGTLYLGLSASGYNSHLYACSPSDGSIIAYFVSYGSMGLSSPAIKRNPNGSTEAGSLYIGCADGKLYAFTP